MKIVTVCGMGLGTSLMLKMTIERVLQERGVRAEVEACDIGQVSGVDADLIVTNPEFVRQIRHPRAKVVSVLNIASTQEVSRVLAQWLDA